MNTQFINNNEVISFLERNRHYLFMDLELFENLNKSKSTYIDKIFKNKIQDDKFHQATIPFVLCMVTIIELFGYIISRRKNYHPRSSKHILEFLKLAQVPIEDIKLFNIFYRNGILGSYIPKNGFCVAAHSKYSSNQLFVKKDELLILNINTLIQITKTTIDIILSKGYINKHIYTMERQFAKMNIANENIYFNKIENE
jgi:hypothetical protein